MISRERTTLVLQIAAAMASYDWADAEYLLDEHAVPPLPLNTYVGGTKDAVRERLRLAEDGVIREVGETVGVAAVAASATAQPDQGLDSGGPLLLFVSHTSAHKSEVSAIRRELATWGVAAFVAHEEIEPTREWQVEIERALQSCDALLAYVTDDFPASRWTDQEVGWAYGRQVPVFAVRAGGDPYGFIGKFQGIRYGREAKDVGPLIETLVQKLLEDDRTSGKATPGVVTAFCSSGSFDTTRSRFSLLTKSPRLSTDHVRELREAMESNSQIKHALIAVAPRTGRPAPELLEELIARKS